MRNNICFIIQPFNEIFDKRYDDIFAPAIEEAGLIPYRVDKDPSATNLIEEIETKIKEAVLCFADISIDNPNVWYELGYAFASSKNVVMVCDSHRTNFPFDVRHKSIITYANDSLQDFENLKTRIKQKLIAYLNNRQSLTLNLTDTPLQSFLPLQPFEVTLLGILIGEQKYDEDIPSIHILTDQMKRAGYTDTATSIGLRMLRNKKFIEWVTDTDWNGNEFSGCRLMPDGEKFVLENLHLFQLEMPAK